MNEEVSAPEPQPVCLAPDGSRAELFTVGSSLADRLEEAIEAARSRVWIETYILGTERFGTRFIELAARAARRGCQVIVLVDQFGSPIFGFRQYRPVVEAGGQAILYNPLMPWRRRGRRVDTPLHRDHRKIVVADDQAFIGGHNLSHEYLAPDPVFHDTTLMLEGPAAEDVARVFRKSYELATGERLAAAMSVPTGDGHDTIAVNEHDLRRGINDAERALVDLLRNARKRCYLALAYFVPPPWLIEELVAAAGRGVDVRVMTAGDTDLPHAREGGRHVYGDLLKGGVRLFELQEPRLHAKNATVDGRFAQVGTFDFNAFTRRYSLEVTVVVESVAIARGLEETFAANSVRSKEIDLDEWEQRGSVRRLVQKACHRLFFLPGGAANGTHRPS